MGRGEGKKHDEPNDTGIDVLGCVDGLFYDPQALHGYILINTIPILSDFVVLGGHMRLLDGDRRQTTDAPGPKISNYKL